MTHALEARKLTRRFAAVTALDALDLVVDAGEIVCLLGANGAGKTTTLNLFLGFLKPTEGEALVFGVSPWAKAAAARAQLAYVPETVALYPHLTGRENLAFLQALGGRAKASAADLDRHLVAAGLDLADTRRRVADYSKGMRQKVALAAAFAKGAKVWLLDEPLSGLDPHAANELSRTVRQAAGDGVAVLMATHDLFRARELGTRIGIMKQGRLVELIDPKTLDHAQLERIYIQHMTEVVET
jgi:ABC-2 type transport system ATP-binding protein